MWPFLVILAFLASAEASATHGEYHLRFPLAIAPPYLLGFFIPSKFPTRMLYHILLSPQSSSHNFNYLHTLPVEINFLLFVHHGKKRTAQRLISHENHLSQETAEWLTERGVIFWLKRNYFIENIKHIAVNCGKLPKRNNNDNNNNILMDYWKSSYFEILVFIGVSHFDIYN